MYTYGFLFYFPVNLAYLLIFCIKGIRKKRKKGYYFFVLLFEIYLNFLIEKAFFPIFTDGAEFYVSLAHYVNLDVTRLFQYTAYQIVGNLLLAFPLGILLPFVIDCTARVGIGASVAISAGIEFVQLMMIATLHLTDVCFDVNDIVLNVAGCLCGIALFSVLCKMDVRLHKKEDGNFIMRYFHQVCRNCAARETSLSHCGEDFH